MKHYVKKACLLTMLCAMLLCSACVNKKNDNEQEKSENQLQEVEQIMAQKEVTWSKHAFLLEGEDIFFVNMPNNWKGVCRQYSALVSIYVPTEGMPSQDQREEFCRLSVAECEDAIKNLEDFTFADKRVGKRNGLKIYSADGKYRFMIENSTTNVQRREYQEQSEKFYDSMMFQNGQIGLTQTESLERRDKVIFHVGWEPLWLDVTVPEGIFFECRASGSYYLTLYIDESKENCVMISYDTDGSDWNEDFWDKSGKILTDESYEEAASYAVYRGQEGKTVYMYGFISREPIFAKIIVPEDNEKMLAAALDIVKSIRFR